MRLIDADILINRIFELVGCETKQELIERCDNSIADTEGWIGCATEILDEIDEMSVEVVRCKYCKHRPYLVPAKYDSSGKCIKYAYVTSPDDVCPYLCDDPWYNRVPEDNFYCGFGDRKEKQDVH